MDQVVQQNAAMVEQAVAATHGLKRDSREMLEGVAKFRSPPGAAAVVRDHSTSGAQPTATGGASPALSLRARLASRLGNLAGAAS
jgi:methyl-accepting chemotaxis protein